MRLSLNVIRRQWRSFLRANTKVSDTSGTLAKSGKVPDQAVPFGSRQWRTFQQENANVSDSSGTLAK